MISLAVRQDAVVAAGHQREVLAAEQPAADDGRRAVRRQLDAVAHAEGDLGPVGLRVKLLRQDLADLDAGDPHVAAVVQPVDPVELGAQRVAAGIAGIAAAIGPGQEAQRHGEHGRTQQRLDNVAGHRNRASSAALRRFEPEQRARERVGLERAQVVDRLRRRRWRGSAGRSAAPAPRPPRPWRCRRAWSRSGRSGRPCP